MSNYFNPSHPSQTFICLRRTGKKARNGLHCTNTFYGSLRKHSKSTTFSLELFALVGKNHLSTKDTHLPKEALSACPFSLSFPDQILRRNTIYMFYATFLNFRTPLTKFLISGHVWQKFKFPDIFEKIFNFRIPLTEILNFRTSLINHEDHSKSQCGVHTS